MYTNANAVRVGDANLRAELYDFPRRLSQLRLLQEECYTLSLSTKPYEIDRVSRGTKACASSPVERIVVRVLSHPQVIQLTALVDAISALYNEAAHDDQYFLLCFWRGEPLPSSFPQRLLARYRSLKVDYGVADGHEVHDPSPRHVAVS